MKIKTTNLNNQLKTKLMLFVFVVSYLIGAASSQACTLAAHDWKLMGYLNLNTGVPLFPVSEADILLTNEYEPVKKAFWINQNADSTKELLNSLLIPFYQSILSPLDLQTYIASGLPNSLLGKEFPAFNWTKALNIIPITSGQELRKHLDPTSKESYIVFGSDNYKIKIALFADANSNYQCFQFVIIQDGRIRAVQANSSSPSAKEAKGLSYLSFIFYGNPFHGKVLSFSLYPIANTRLFFIQNEELVAQLLYEEKLLPRLSVENDPASYDIPELPE